MKTATTFSIELQRWQDGYRLMLEGRLAGTQLTLQEAMQLIKEAENENISN